MTNLRPIACTLTADGYRSRLAAMRDLAARALTGRTPVPGGARLTFAAADGVEARLRALVAAEAECCAFLRFDLAAGPEQLALTVTGPPEAQALVAELFRP